MNNKAENKESFLDRQSSNNISGLLKSIIVAIDQEHQSCWRERINNLISTITEVALYQKEHQNTSITAESIEKLLSLENLISLTGNNNTIKDENIKNKINNYLHLIPGLYNSKEKEFIINEVSAEQHNFISRKIKHALIVIKQLDSSNYS